MLRYTSRQVTGYGLRVTAKTVQLLTVRCSLFTGANL